VERTTTNSHVSILPETDPDVSSVPSVARSAFGGGVATLVCDPSDGGRNPTNVWVLPEAESSAVGRDGNLVGGASSSLVDLPHNSPGPLDDWTTEESWAPPSQPCPNPRLTLGECVEHGQQRMVYGPCKSRLCEVCGPRGRYEIAMHIARGVHQFWPCSWHILTFDTCEAEESKWKPVAVRKLGKYVAWLRKQIPDLQYAATYELTQQGRLHINLIIGPWRYIRQRVLQKQWGSRMWVARVKDSETIGRETAKSYSPESLGMYLAKLKQSVPKEWGRRCSFSKGWPKAVESEPFERKGKITWRHEWDLKPEEIASFEFERSKGWWRAVPVGDGFRTEEWQNLLGSHDCDCFELRSQKVRDGPQSTGSS